MYTFNLTKAIALTQSMIRECSDNDGLNYMKCLKVMYLCERQMYESFRKFITYDSFVSMRHGPVLSNTYNFMIENDLLKENKNQQYWNHHIERKEYNLYMPTNANDISHNLDRQEKIVAGQIARAFGELDTWELVEMMHETCKEWRETDSSIPITESDIASAVHSETADEIYQRILNVHL